MMQFIGWHEHENAHMLDRARPQTPVSGHDRPHGCRASWNPGESAHGILLVAYLPLDDGINVKHEIFQSEIHEPHATA